MSSVGVVWVALRGIAVGLLVVAMVVLGVLLGMSCAVILVLWLLSL
jgi:hypothetical protein